MVLIGTKLRSASPVWRELAQNGQPANDGLCSGVSSCHDAGIPMSAYLVSECFGSDQTPSSCRFGRPQTELAARKAHHVRPRITRIFVATTGQKANSEPNGNVTKGSTSCSKNSGSFQSLQSRACRPVWTPIWNAALQVRPQVRLPLICWAQTQSSAPRLAVLRVSFVTTCASLPANKTFGPVSGRSNHLDRRRVHCARTAVLHSKDPCRCSKRS